MPCLAAFAWRSLQILGYAWVLGRIMEREQVDFMLAIVMNLQRKRELYVFSLHLAFQRNHSVEL